MSKFSQISSYVFPFSISGTSRYAIYRPSNLRSFTPKSIYKGIIINQKTQRKLNGYCQVIRQPHWVSTEPVEHKQNATELKKATPHATWEAASVSIIVTN